MECSVAPLNLHIVHVCGHIHMICTKYWQIITRVQIKCSHLKVYCALQVSSLEKVWEWHLSLSLYKLKACVTCSKIELSTWEPLPIYPFHWTTGLQSTVVALYIHHFLFNRKQLPPPVGWQVTPPLVTSPPTTKVHQPISLRSYLLLLICQQFTKKKKKKITRVCQTTPSVLVGTSIPQCMTLSQTPCGYLEGGRAQGDFATPG